MIFPPAPLDSNKFGTTPLPKIQQDENIIGGTLPSSSPGEGGGGGGGGYPYGGVSSLDKCCVLGYDATFSLSWRPLTADGSPMQGGRWTETSGSWGSIPTSLPRAEIAFIEFGPLTVFEKYKLCCYPQLCTGGSTLTPPVSLTSTCERLVRGVNEQFGGSTTGGFPTGWDIGGQGSAWGHSNWWKKMGCCPNFCEGQCKTYYQGYTIDKKKRVKFSSHTHGLGGLGNIETINDLYGDKIKENRDEFMKKNLNCLDKLCS